MNAFRDFVSKTYEDAVTSDPGCKKAVEHFAVSGNPVAFFEELCLAAKKMNFNLGLPINVTSVKAVLELDTIRNLIVSEYKG